jgi:hypothetical protein
MQYFPYIVSKKPFAQWFRKNVSNHVGGRIELNPNIVVCNELTDIVELNVDMLASRMVLRVLSKLNGGFIVIGNRDSELALQEVYITQLS